MVKISVIGSGGWGIALAILLHKNGHNLTIWSFDKKEAEELKINRQNKTKLPNILLPEDIKVTDNLKEAVDNKDILVLAVPSKAIRSVSKSLKDIIKDNQIIVNVAKGLEEDTLKTMTDIIEEELKEKNPQVAVLSGPSHAEEVGKGIPTTCVVSAHNKELTLYLQNIFMNPSFRVYTSPDMIGVEIGGALKNVIALAAGIADGLNYGDNTKAALITRGIKEISSLGVAMGGEQSTFYGLTGLGDLIVTCASMHSRNRRAGILLGQGKTLDEAIKEVNMVVEGIYSAKSALMAAKKYNVEIPIIEQVNAVLFENKNAAEAVNELMIRDKKLEIQSW
ncbi:glycerol-3-phosphate dehydrogenase (NAD(P)(+)) [Fusobacterium nucleatum subsp. nucleatum ATCC 25586]|uniref:Glycerol-3-phosphate dehydrogenase [NAD(P)+] n=3 Tax=Fusobacterium nucleatum subsp. nucleatum TaxID=76856 RepID=GPDA_FUSNN|nr:NAD(P)H-dependent glycerol-3-phosphate dehydrogenase [Fusobacterium nucleatum]Q8RF18.1 RecName: Full=Glycerol-3-phosphate dehydrogenase [NAD(P)+]; AltName: Full=NAD(P)H-dependent glycerol-3-phosphate dehydrogenase [Fusobacterium nucleatum subsp. nucleatum ATCC 25586]AAL95102.1 Glycerol-3-phosphate dehydrogenase [NAD(P)+] [Fusobacterium nucleatum subsp. nucleatum ATCC 25586]AVQ15272.1 glycerol-3-phosphate dehydrogenase (NAD(P)(+)) [Fusobacterium nucleatum subsp. nucleatum ATCC 25586]KUL98693.